MTTLTLAGGVVLAVVLVVFGVATIRSRRGAEGVTVIESGPRIPKQEWTMPPLIFLERTTWSAGRRAAMIGLRCYLILSTVLLIVKAIQLGGG